MKRIEKLEHSCKKCEKTKLEFEGLRDGYSCDWNR